MKLPLLIYALVLSVQGWCASVIPSQRTASTITPSHQIIKNEKLQEKISRPLLVDKIKVATIGWGLITYLIFIIGWANTAKNSLDKILKDVLKEIAQYS